MATVGVEYVVQTAQMYAELQKLPGVTKQVLAKMAKEGAEVVAEQQRMIVRSASVSAGAIRNTAGAATQLGVSSGNAKAGLFSLQQQMMDVGVMLQGGMSPATILATQGPQIATAVQQMGGAGAALKSVMAGVGPYLGVLGPVGVAVAGLGVTYGVLTSQLRAAEAAQAAESAEASAAQVTHQRLESVIRGVHDAYLLYTGATTDTAIRQRDTLSKVATEIGGQMDSVRGKIAANVAEQKRLRDQLAAPKNVSERGVGTGLTNEVALREELKRLEQEVGPLNAQLGGLGSRLAVVSSEAFIGSQKLDKQTASVRAAKEAVDELAKSLEARVGLEAPFRTAMESLSGIRDAQRDSILNPEDARRAQAMATSKQIQDAQLASQALVLTDTQRSEVSTRTAEAMTATWRAYYHDIDEMRQKDADKEAKAQADKEKQALQAAQSILTSVGSAASQLSSSMSQASANQVAYLNALEADRDEMSANMTTAERRHSRDRVANAREEALKGFRIAQGAAAVGALVNTASAVVAAMDDAPFPGNLALMGLAAGAGAVQLGVILGAQPSFARGTSDVGDGFGATLHPREAVANSVGADMIGRGNIDRANAGIPAPQVIRVNQMYQHRSFDTFIGDNWDMFGALRQRVQAGSFPGSREWGT